jgi:hypothetical protein
MINPLISIGGQKVVSHGTLVLYGSQEIDFYPLPKPNDSYRVQIIFKLEPDHKSEWTRNIIGQDHIALTFINFDNALGAATAQPIYVANFGAEKLLLNIANIFIGEGETGTRMFSYTFVLGGPANA